MKEVTITYFPDGKVKMEVTGAEGGSCVDLTKDLEAALGNGESTTEFKPEYNKKQSERNTTRN